MKMSKRDRFDAARRKFLEDCLRYGSAFIASGSLAYLASCSKIKNNNNPDKLLITEIKKPDINQNVVGVAKSGNPYDLTRRAVDSIGGMKEFVHDGESVMLLPNMAWDRKPEQAANTHPDVVRAIIEMCMESGAREVGVFCHPCHPAQSSYKLSGIAEMADKAGARVWYLTKGRDFKNVVINGMNIKNTKVFSKLLESDKFINIPIAKVHSLAGYTMCMKNLLGAIEDRPVFHPEIHQNVADLNMVLKPDLNIIDATRILVRNGPTGGSLADVRKPETIIAAVNPVSADSVGMNLFNRKPDKLGCLPIAQKLGRGEFDTKLLEIREA
jgi:uncharacterized protein (DUF362 family)